MVASKHVRCQNTTGAVRRGSNETPNSSLPDYKPVSVPFVTEERQPFLLAGNLSPAPATYPEVLTERTAPAPLFGLAQHGVCPASRITAAAVRSYRTFSPLPDSCLPGGIVFCGTFRKARFERAPPAVSRHAALWRPDFPPARLGFPAQASGCPSGRPAFIIGVATAKGQYFVREFRPSLRKSLKSDETYSWNFLSLNGQLYSEDSTVNCR